MSAGSGPAIPAARAAGAAPTVFPGSAELAEVSEKTGVPLSSEDYTTLSGFLFGALGRLPKAGDRVEVKGGGFEVTAMDGRRISQARFVKK